MKRDKKLDKEIQGLVDAVELGIDWGIPIPQQQYEKYQKIKEGTLCSINSENSIHMKN